MSTLWMNSTMQKKLFRLDSVSAGIFAGILGGIFMAIFWMVASAIASLGFWHPMELVGGMFYGVDSILGGVGPVLTGIFLHLFGTAALGAAFGAILPLDRFPGISLSSGQSATWGILFGMAAWAAATFVVLPALNETMSQRVALAAGWWFFSFLLFGSTLGITPMLRRAISHQVESFSYELNPRRAA